eukprot:3591851-Amphidinium_carterae.1
MEVRSGALKSPLQRFATGTGTLFKSFELLPSVSKLPDEHTPDKTPEAMSKVSDGLRWHLQIKPLPTMGHAESSHVRAKLSRKALDLTQQRVRDVHVSLVTPALYQRLILESPSPTHDSRVQFDP